MNHIMGRVAGKNVATSRTNWINAVGLSVVRVIRRSGYGCDNEFMDSCTFSNFCEMESSNQVTDEKSSCAIGET